MGKIADAIEEVEEELKEVKVQLKIEENKNSELETAVERMRKQIYEYEDFVYHIEEQYPGLYTAFEVAQRMEK